MLKKVEDSTVIILKNKALNELNINRKITEEDIEIILEFFCNEEISYANAEADGVTIDRQYLLDAAHAVDDFLLTDDDRIDIDDLNKRLQF